MGVCRTVRGGLAWRECDAAAAAVPAACGLATSSGSRRFIRATAQARRRLQERRLEAAEWLVLVLDGKTFAGDQRVLAQAWQGKVGRTTTAAAYAASPRHRLNVHSARDTLYTSGVAGLPLNWVHATLAILGVALLHLASNVFNDYFDVRSGTDAANTKDFTQHSGGSRAIELRLIDLRNTLNVAVAFAVIALAIGLYLTWGVGTGVLILGLIGLFCGYFYTAPPIRLVAWHGIGEITIGMASVR